MGTPNEVDFCSLHMSYETYVYIYIFYENGASEAIFFSAVRDKNGEDH
jgi:hypothetical protein